MRPAPELPERGDEPQRARLPFMLPALAAAALIVLMAGGAWLARQRIGLALAGWEVARVDGAPRVGGEAIRDAVRLDEGEWVETDASARARLSAGWIGQVDVEPDTRLGLVEARTTGHRLALRRGTIHARISAPPRFFSVETPSAVAVDMGCTYTLEVDDAGTGRLRVTAGWVSFEWRGRESFVPAGARCTTRPGVGPGTPHFDDAPEALREALDEVDAAATSPEARSAALGVVLSAARRRDALTLWHLLPRVEGGDRGRVYDGLARMHPPPAGVTRGGLLEGDKEMLDRWWGELGLGTADWWRKWKTSLPAKPSGH